MFPTSKRALTMLACALFAAAAYARRDTISLNFGWQFMLNDSVIGPDAEMVDLPHDFQTAQPWLPPSADERADCTDMAANVKSRLSARGFKEMGVGWYRKVIRPDRSWRGRHMELDFGGIMLVGDVFLNGRRIGGTDYGYVGFGIDITDMLDWQGDNELTVRADTRAENNSRWYTGGGIIRDVRLIVSPAEARFVRHPLRITADTTGRVAVESELFIAAKTMDTVVIGARILDADGCEVASSITRTAYDRRRKHRVYALDTLQVDNPELWDCDRPFLYTAEVTLYDADGRAIDRVSDRFGIRSIEFGPDFGFRLNGRKTLLKGIANHHTLGALGAAAYPRAIEKRIRLLKQFGFNHIRASHNPYSEDFYRLCDEYGILVVDELYDKWLKQYAGGRAEWSELWQRDIPEWVKANRNHPSVIMWSLGNELQTYSNLPFGDWGVTPYRLQRELLRAYDTTRPTTVAMHPRGRSFETDSLPCDLARITDIQAYNYRYMYFPGDGCRFPYMTFYQSEANITMMGPNYYGMNLDKVVGLAYWGMIDYVGESLGWPAKGWKDGVFDISLRPKPMAWFLKSMFTDEPVVRIAVVEEARGGGEEWNGVRLNTVRRHDHWNHSVGDTFTVCVYTNADEAELKLNGRSLGTRRNRKDDPQRRNRMEWQGVRYEPGTLVATARNAAGKPVSHAVETAGKAVRLLLEPDGDAWQADGTDLMHVRLTAVDGKGRRDPSAEGRVTFAVEGDARIVAVDNGDIENHEISTASAINLHAGTSLVILRSGHNPGRVTLTATAEQMKSSVKMQTVGQ